MGRNNYIAATWSFASHLMNGKSGVFLPFNGKFLSNLLGCPVLLHSCRSLVVREGQELAGSTCLAFHQQPGFKR
jgi:hypothetical protein